MDMKFHTASGQMKIVTTCERIQPFVVGVDKNGELIWEGRAMPRWQMEMFKMLVDMFGQFFSRWLEVATYQDEDREFDKNLGGLSPHRAVSKKHLAQMRRTYTQKKRRRVQEGD